MDGETRARAGKAQRNRATDFAAGAGHQGGAAGQSERVEGVVGHDGTPGAFGQTLSRGQALIAILQERDRIVREHVGQRHDGVAPGAIKMKTDISDGVLRRCGDRLNWPAHVTQHFDHRVTPHGFGPLRRFR